MLSVIAVAHLGLFLLLTVSARREAAAIEALRGTSALEAAVDPGPPPRETEDVARWNQRQALWEDARALHAHRSSIRLFGIALLASFFVQTGLLAVLLRRGLASARRAATSRRPASARPSAASR